MYLYLEAAILKTILKELTETCWILIKSILVYIACGATDLRRNIDMLALIVQTEVKLDSFEKALCKKD